MEALINEFFAGVTTVLIGSIITIIKMWSDLQSIKKDVGKLEEQQAKDDVKFETIIKEIGEVKILIAALNVKANAN